MEIGDKSSFEVAMAVLFAKENQEYREFWCAKASGKLANKRY